MYADVRVYCDEHWYGDVCSTLCAPHDDQDGHYTCEPATGRKICMEGEKKDSIWEYVMCGVFFKTLMVLNSNITSMNLMVTV